jgi:O-antigen ligase
MAYTQFDSSSGALLRLEQVHNDYLQVLADTGVIGAALGLFYCDAVSDGICAARERRRFS